MTYFASCFVCALLAIMRSSIRHSHLSADHDRTMADCAMLKIQFR